MRKRTTKRQPKKLPSIFDRFESLSEFSDTIQARLVQPCFTDRYGEIMPSDCTGAKIADFTKTENFAAADELLRGGYIEGLNMIVQNMPKIDYGQGNMFGGSMLRREPVGFSPCVPAVVAGLPNAMYNTRKRPNVKKVVTIIYNTAVGADISTESVAKVGGAICGAIQTLEGQGIRVNLYGGMFVELYGYATSQHIGLTIKLKDSKQPLNIANIAYPFIHASFLRRHLFKWEESLQGISADFTHQYGLPRTDADEIRADLPSGLTDAAIVGYYDLRGKSAEQVMAIIADRLKTAESAK